jgi:hypothetical protein
MKTLTDLIEGGLLSQKIDSQLGLSNSITQMLQSQQQWQNKLSGFGMHNALLKSIGEQHTLYARNFSGIDAIAKSIAMQPKFNIPTTAFDVITAISKQHNELFGNFRGITEMLQKQQAAFSQVNNLRFAMEGISGQMATIAAAQKQWSYLDDFRNISEQAIEISNSITSDIALTEEESKRFEKLIELILTFFQRNKKFGTNALLFLSVVVNLMALHQYYDFIKEKPEPATKEDLAKFERKIIQEITIKLKEQKEYRTTNRICKVMFKPKLKSFLVTTLPNGFDVVVLQSNHKWILISYSNPNDNMPETGWALKKYFNQPK